MGADLYMLKKNPKIWGFERSKRAVKDGYFRDPYNTRSVLRKYELSWWQDIIPLQDEKGILSVEKVTDLLSMLESRESIFQENLKGENEAAQADFKEGARLLKKFLSDAIKLNSPIEASL